MPSESTDSEMTRVYFELSQEIKKDVLRDHELMNALARHYGLAEGFPLQVIGKGSLNTVYSLGKTRNGIYVALREEKTVTQHKTHPNCFQSPPAGLWLKEQEHYCLTAEKLFSQGKQVPGFCIGVICGMMVGVVTEDLTEGRKYLLSDNKPGEQHGTRTRNGIEEKLYFDLDNIGEAVHIERLKYLLPQNTIDLLNVFKPGLPIEDYANRRKN